MSDKSPALDYDAVLREWWIIDFVYESSLVGRVFGDRRRRFTDGRWIITSAIKTPRRRVMNGQIVCTKNTRYLLVGATN